MHLTARRIPAVARQFWRDANYRRQALVTPDGGLIALDWYHGSDTLPDLPESTPVLMVFHGLTGRPTVIQTPTAGINRHREKLRDCSMCDKFRIGA